MPSSFWLFLCTPLILLACSKDSSPSSSSTAAGTAVTTANAKLKAVSDMIDGVSSTSLNFIPQEFNFTSRASGINAVWATDPGVSDLYNNGSYSLKQWFIDEFDESFENSNGAKVTFAGRISNTLAIFCYMANSGVTVDSTGLPPAGTYTLTISQTMLDNCGGSSDMLNTQTTLTAAATTTTTNYDRSLSFTFDGQENCPFRVLARVNSTEVNIATAEDQTCEGRDYASHAVFMYNATEKVTRFYYASKNFDAGDYPAGFETYRGYLNEDSDEAYVAGFFGSDADGTAGNLSGVSYAAVGKPSAGGTVALSAKVTSQTIADGTYQGCVDSSDLTVTTDNSLNCTLTGTDADTTHTNVIQGIFTSLSTLDGMYDIDDTTTVGFTDDSDIFN